MKSLKRQAGGITIQIDGGSPFSLPAGFDSIIQTSDSVVYVNTKSRVIKLLTSDTIIINDVAFAGTAAQLVAKLRDEVFHVDTALRQILVSNVAQSHTGGITETTKYTGSIPANTIGVNGSFEIRLLLSATNNANAKTVRVKFNGITIAQYDVASLAAKKVFSAIHNRNSLTSQIMLSPSSAANAGFNAADTAAPAAYTFNTGAAITVTITIQNAVGTDTTTIEAFQLMAIE